MWQCWVSVGVGGRVKCKVKGTISWTIEDDQGRAHDIIVPDTPLCAALPYRLFLPQHWSQEIERCNTRKLKGAGRPLCSTNADKTVLTWGQGKFTKTIKLDKGKNVAVMMTKFECQKFTAFATSVALMEPDVCSFVATGAPEPPGVTIVTDGEESAADDEESIPSASIDQEVEGVETMDFELPSGESEI
jgi:hypothetical protein